MLDKSLCRGALYGKPWHEWWYADVRRGELVRESIGRKIFSCSQHRASKAVVKDEWGVRIMIDIDCPPPVQAAGDKTCGPSSSAVDAISTGTLVILCSCARRTNPVGHAPRVIAHAARSNVGVIA